MFGVNLILKLQNQEEVQNVNEIKKRIMSGEPKVTEVDEYGIRQVSQITTESIHKTYFESETEKEVLRISSREDGKTVLEFIDVDFWKVTVDGNSAEEQEIKSFEGKSYKILILPEDRVVEIITDY